MFSCDDTSETEAGLPGGHFKPRFSLYSTDTEEQVASVNRGLDRCAALLRDLLSPDKSSAEQKGQVAKQQEPDVHLQDDKENQQPNILSSRLTGHTATCDKSAGEKKEQGHTHPQSTDRKEQRHTHPQSTDRKEQRHTHPQSTDRKEQRHTHPNASSTPIPHSDPSAPEPLVTQIPTGHHADQLSAPPTSQAAESALTQRVLPTQHVNDARVVTFGRKEGIEKLRKPKRAHRRQQSEPRKPFVVSRNPPKSRPLVGVRVRPSVRSQQHTTTLTTPTPVTTCAGGVRNPVKSTKKHSVTTPSSMGDEPTPTPPPLYGLPPALPYVPYLPPPPPSSLPNVPCPPWLGAELAGTGHPSSWFPCVPLWFPCSDHLTGGSSEETGRLTTVGGAHTLITGGSPAAITTRAVSSAGCSEALTFSPLTAHSGPMGGVGSGGLPLVVEEGQKQCPLNQEESGRGSISMDETERQLMKEIAMVEERLKETGHPELVSCLDQLKSCVAEQCRVVGQSEPLPPLPVSHWLRQIGQLEQEKAHLLQRVMVGESAYAEVKGQLEQARREKSSIHEQVEAHRRELDVLREDLQSTKNALSLMDKEHTITIEECSEARLSAEAKAQEVMDENKELKKKLTHLETELSKKESVWLPERLSQLQVSMETAQQELAMIRVTIAEKDTQLLQAQDQLLGLRQCLAHLLSHLKPLLWSGDHPTLSHDRHYTLSSQLVGKLHSLINNGDVDKFLLETSKGCSQLSSVVGGDGSSSHSTSTLTEPGNGPPSPVAGGQVVRGVSRGPPSVSATSSQVITPLNLSAEQRSHADQTTPSSDHSTTPTPSTISYPPPLSPCPKGGSETLSPGTTVTPGGSESVLSKGLSCHTTASEMEFRRDLASLDADIARLQIQFRVALQTTHSA